MDGLGEVFSTGLDRDRRDHETEVAGCEHPDLAADLNSLAGFHHAQGSWATPRDER